jgi:hypothetical protein
MSSLNNINNNASVVNVGRTTPVTPGAQPANKSIPVVVATDQTAIPVVEQNKIQSEVALSLLGIPRSEVALGIFADVNTYDVNPSEWSNEPAEYDEKPNTATEYTNIGGFQGHGIAHLPEESGAIVTAPANETAILTSKRFFRYQPGRVSAATFGIKSSSLVGTTVGPEQREPVRNPPIRKYGIFDKFDGYYWETRDTSDGDQFAVVRRTQSILRYNPLQFGNQPGEQLEDHGLAGKPPAQLDKNINEYPTATEYLSDNRDQIIRDSVVSNTAVKCQRDLGYFLDAVGYDMTLGTNYNATFQGLAESNSNEYPLNQTVIDAINDSETAVKALTGISGVTNPTTQVDNFYNRLSAIAIDAGTRVDYTSSTQTEQINFLKGITFTNPSNATAGQIAAKDAIQANYDYLADEVNSYIEEYYPSSTHNRFKCTRDVLFAVNAATYDVLYGGNSATHDAARFFFYDGFSKSDQTGDFKETTVAAYKHLKGIIDDVVLGQAYAPQARCTRDLEYILEGIGYDITLGTNYHSTFLGLAESNSTEYPEDSTEAIAAADGSPWGRVLGAVEATQTSVKALAGVDNTADAAVDNFYDRLYEVAFDENTRVEYYSPTQAKQIAFLKGITFTDPTSGRTASQIAVKDKIQANYDFLTAEINAWVAQQYPDSTHPVAKCTRDVLFVANAVAHDMLYGGNYATTQATQFFFYEDFAQTTEVHKNQTVAAYERLVEIIKDVVEGTEILPTSGNTTAQVTTGTDADAADGTAAAALVQVFVDAIDAGNENGIPATVNPSVSWAGLSYTNAKTAIDNDISSGVGIAPTSSSNAYSGYNFPSETQDTTYTATIAEARRYTDLIGIVLGVIKEGDILTSLPGNRDVPSVSWSASEYQTARDAIIENKDSIINGIVTVTYSADDVKCIRDMDFAMDAYINDLKYGGNGHIISNAATYNTALLLDAEREGETHYTLRYNIRDALWSIGETGARDRIGDLAGYQIQAVTSQGTPGSKYPPQAGPDGTTGYISASQIANANWGQRGKVETIFSVYDKYYGYLVSESIAYDTEVDGVTYDEDVLKYKCIRDVRYVMGAYGSDVQYGGNSATAYNAYKYYEGDTLKVFSQASGGVVAEIARHEYLKQLLTSESAVTVTKSDASTTTIDSLVDRFGLSETQRDKLNTLADLIIGNFTTKYTGAIDYGSAGQWGDLVILRDGLIMTHGAVYDPSLLKPRKKIPARIDTGNDAIVMSSGEVIIGQYVNYYGDAGGLTDGKTYYVANVIGPKSSTIQLVDPLADGFDPAAIRPSDFTPIDITSEGTESFIEIPVPFIFPDDYNQSYGLVNTQEEYGGMFPYLYSSSGVLPAESTDVTIGYIDTAIDTSADPTSLREQIDALNYKYKTWVRDHVNPSYYSVYEYRVPRSRFSGDSLDGSTRNAVYSDNVLDKKSGQLFTKNDLAVEEVSVWDMDFSKVTMLKVEFSWYGAVGALFLAYVPVDNGDARWVRVHHLRCSNQLKISSLGNATLPITYLVYGGGSESRFGIENASRLQNPYGSYSEFVVKYGASYYIDGGDRGTVRLYNHSSETPTNVHGSRFKLGVDQGNSDPTNPTAPYFRINSRDPDATGTNAPAVSTYYMNAKVITGNTQDQNVKVIWVDGNDLYLNKPVSDVSSFELIVDRPSLVYGLKTKANIVSGDGDEVRNRVQVYPTRLSIGSSGSTNAKVALIKTPKFQSNTSTTGSLAISSASDLNESYVISVSNQDYLSQNGQFTYGYFRASLNGSETLISVLGRLEKANDQYYFYPEDIYNGTLELASNAVFLKEGIFDPKGNPLTGGETTFEKERLSSVEVALRAQTPIPGSGTELASYYCAPGAEDFDLATYFDYNKEYISYPLTNELQTLFLATFSNNTYSSTAQVSLSASLTWEEQ